MKLFEKKTKPTTFFFTGFVILTAIILTVGYQYNRYAVKSYRVQVDEQLSAIADLKVRELMNWRDERLGDASLFYKNPLFSSLVKRYLDDKKDADAVKRIHVWMQKLQEHYDYENTFLMDVNGVELLSVPNKKTPVSSIVSRACPTVIKSKQIAFVDFYRNEHDNRIYLAVIAPIIDAQDSTHVLGILGLRIDPEHYLYPFISSWPTPSKTAETLLLRREGNEVVFLNDLKFQKDAALNLRAPMNGTKAIPAIKAALGEEGIVEALDYRGVPVIAAIRTIHGSPWFMVTRMDQAEEYAPLKERLSIIVILIGLLLIGVGAGFGFIWKQQRIRFYREKFETSKRLVESEERFRLVTETANDAIVSAESTGTIIGWNRAAEKIFGYKESEIIGQSLTLLIPPEYRELHINGMKRLELGGEKNIIGKTVEVKGLHKNGNVFPLDLSLAEWEISTGKYYTGIIRDTTERKQKEEQLIIQSTALNAVANAVAITNITGKIEWVNPAFTKLTGYTLEEVMGENPRTLKSGKHDDAFYKNLWDTILAGKDWRGELINRRKDGSEYTEEMTITPLLDNNGDIIRFIAIKQDNTERNQAEKQLQKSEENVRLLLDSTAEAIYGIDLEGKCTFSNKSCLRLLGYERSDQLIGMDMHNLIHHSRPDGSPLPKEDCSIYKAFQSGKGTHKDDEVFWRADGTSFPVEYWSYPIFRNGKIEGSVATFLDITERKWIEETQTFLLQCGYSESDGNFFESLAQYLAKTLDMDYVCIDKLHGDLLTAQTVAVYYDGKFEDNIEYTLKETPCGEVVGKTICYFPQNVRGLFPNDQALQEMLAESYIGATLFSNSGQPIGLIALIGRKPLKNRYLAESILKLVAIRAAGEMERKFAEEEIKKLQQQIDYIYGATKTGLHIVDIDFVLHYVSPALQQIYGNYTGRKCYEYYKEFDEACEECLIKQAIETGLNVQYETTYPLENNRPVQATTIPFQDKDGKWLAAEVTVDITERKKFEEELSIAKAEAERANIAKSEFLSRMSHELRTPMNSILGFAQLMDMGELKPVHKKGVDHILKSGKHLLDLINEVLELSRIEAGKLTISLEPVQLSGMIAETMDIINPLATQRNLKLQVINSESNHQFVKADRQKLKQVLLNLASNAVKYNRDGGSVWVEVHSPQSTVGNGQSIVGSQEHTEDWRLETEDWRLPTLRISITDSGKGISPEGIQKLFNPFQRIGAEVSEVEGTGLGLTIAKKIVEAMNGTIGVESEVGVGSTFWIELPQCEGQIDLHKRKGDFIKPETESAVSGTLLYIEDNVSNIQLVEQILEAHRPQIRLITEMYGKRTAKLATDFKPSVILLDLDLPDIHGSEVLKLLQRNEKTKSIPVVIISADAMSHSVEQLMKAGAKNYLTKPLDVLEFLRVVDEYLSKSTRNKL